MSTSTGCRLQLSLDSSSLGFDRQSIRLLHGALSPLAVALQQLQSVELDGYSDVPVLVHVYSWFL